MRATHFWQLKGGFYREEFALAYARVPEVDRREFDQMRSRAGWRLNQLTAEGVGIKNAAGLCLMKSACVILLLASLLTSAAAELLRGQLNSTLVPAPRPHYEPEYTDDARTATADWSKEQKGLRVAFGSTDERYLRCEPPLVPPNSDSLKISGWRGERLNAQILIWSREAHSQVRLEASDLRSGTGQTISRAQVQLRLVRYVLSNLPYEANGFTCDTSNTVAYLLPDRLERIERFDLPEQTVRPVWFSLDVPADAKPGEYRGTILVRSAHGTAALPLQVRVRAALLPEPQRWKFRLDLWQNPWALSSFFQVVPWSDEHKLLLREHLKLYADAGGKYITTYATHSPWSDNSFVLEGAMIEWIKARGGEWKFDYTIFDEYVELAMSVGIREAITIYTPVPWGYRFRYLDEASGNYVQVEWPPTSEAFRSFWHVFLEDLKKHLLAKGWWRKTYLGINENPLAVTLAAIKVIKEHSPEWRVTYAGDWHPELTSVLDDYSVVIPREPSPAEVGQRSAKGLTTTFYVCCNPPRPNNFVFSAPVESRYLGWYAAAAGYDGFLRWAYDAWPADPNRDARHTLWPAGDCFLVYPGAASSIRFEKLREGIADFEKLRLLREKSASSTNAKTKQLMEELHRHLAAVLKARKDPNQEYAPSHLRQLVTKGNELLDALAQELEP